VAGAWQLPLFRLDFGTLYNKFHGETERNLREVLKMAAAMSPCVLWMDEIEKGIAAAGSDSDGGVSQRVLGTLLTWMAERTERLFLVVTANDIQRLPPELLRKGRFDEIFFVDLPDKAVRADILRIHLARRKQNPADFDLTHLAAASAGFSGAEIEQAILSGLYEAHAGNKPLDTGILSSEFARTRPLSVVCAEEIATLREWARERTVPGTDTFTPRGGERDFWGCGNFSRCRRTFRISGNPAPEQALDSVALVSIDRLPCILTTGPGVKQSVFESSPAGRRQVRCKAAKRQRTSGPVPLSHEAATHRQRYKLIAKVNAQAIECASAIGLDRGGRKPQVPGNSVIRPSAQ
jgi:hypothetical protein